MNRKFASVLVAAFALRALVAWSGVSHGLDRVICADDYLAVSAQWQATGQFPAHALFFPPLYPLLCRAMQLMCGTSAVYGVLAAQVVLGTATVGFIGLVARRITGSERASLLAGAVAAADPLLLVHTPLVLTETLYTFLLTALVAALVCLDEKRRWHFVLLGVVVGLALLTRSVGIALWPVLVVLWGLRRWPWPWLGAVALIAFAFCLPRMLDNRARFGRFEVTASGKYNIAALWFGQAKAMVDHKEYGANLTMWGVGPEDGDSTFAQADAAFPVAKAWAREHPSAVVRAVAQGVARLLIGPGVSYYRGVVGWAVPAYSVVGAVYRGILLIAAIVGAWVLLKRDLRIALLIGGLLAVHTLAPGAAGYSRFAVPGETLEIMLAAVALERFFAARETPVLSATGSAPTR